MKKISVKTARKALTVALKEPGLRQSYVANIALCIYDNRRKDGRLNKHNCNDVAEKIIHLMFS